MAGNTNTTPRSVSFHNELFPRLEQAQQDYRRSNFSDTVCFILEDWLDAEDAARARIAEADADLRELNHERVHD